jgi:hypothetical protein
MEQRNHHSRTGVDAGQIGLFVRITSVACEREAGRIVGTAVLYRHDVFHVEGNQRGVAISERRQYTHALPGLDPNGTGSSLVQLRSPAREEMAGLCLHYGNDIGGLDKVLVLGILGGRELPSFALQRNSSIRASRSGSARRFRRAEGVPKRLAGWQSGHHAGA